MTNLNKSLIDEIYSALERSDFGLANFEADFPYKGKYIIIIAFKPYPDYKFIVHDVGGNPHRVAIEESPGDFLKFEVNGGLGFESISIRIASWTENIKMEIQSHGVRDKNLDEITSQIDQLVNQHVDKPERKFDQSEITDLENRLQKLEARFEGLLEDNKITKNELVKLKGQIVQASEDIPKFSKGVWYRLSLNKIVGTLKEIIKSKEGRDILKEAIKKMIGL